MASSSKVPSGCWTCKLRKKKCDSVKPKCGPCAFRQLMCHGYGEKPGFLFSPDDQQREIKKIQQAVSESLKARRAFRIAKAPNRSQRLPQPFRGAGQPESDSAASLSAAYQSQLSLGPIHEAHPIQDRTLPVYNENSNVPLGAPGSKSEQRDRIIYPYTYMVSAPLAENEDELALINNYMDTIFPLTYYFYQPTESERGRDWLLNLLIHSKSSYYITLVLSILQQLIFMYDGQIEKEQELCDEIDRYHTLGIAELQKQLEYLPRTSGPDHLKLGVEILACTVQLMTIEVFRNRQNFKWWKGDWEVHLDAAATLLGVIGTELNTSSNSPEPGEAPKTAPLTFQNFPIDDYAGFDFFMTIYVWANTVRSASIGCKQSKDTCSYIAYLQEDRIRLDRIMGCKNWAMIAVREISALQSWKAEMIQQRSLNMPMLYRKAEDIESNINKGLLLKPANLSKYESESFQVTRVTAHASLVYLSVIVSGNSHMRPEIRLRVPKALSALKEVPGHLLIRVSWSFCVVGCMVSDEEKDQARGIFLSALHGCHQLGTAPHSMEIMEKFWTMRDDPAQLEGRHGTPWALAMQDMGLKILLV